VHRWGSSVQLLEASEADSREDRNTCDPEEGTGARAVDRGGFNQTKNYNKGEGIGRDEQDQNNKTRGKRAKGILGMINGSQELESSGPPPCTTMRIPCYAMEKRGCGEGGRGEGPGGILYTQILAGSI